MMTPTAICLVCLVLFVFGLLLFALLRSVSVADAYLDDLDGAPDMDYRVEDHG